MSLANDLAEREMNALRAANRLTDAEVEQRWAWMAIALREQPNLPDVLDRVCKQAIEANALRAALAEALDGWEREHIEAIRATASPAQAEIDIANSEDCARIAELRAKHLEGK